MIAYESHASQKLSLESFTGEVTIVLPSNWMPPEGADAERLNFTGTISSINFDQVPIRIVAISCC